MDPDTMTWPRSITFTAGPAATAPASACNAVVGPCIDFCGQIKGTTASPGVFGGCLTGVCHQGSQGGAPVPVGLDLTTSTLGSSLAGTAIGRLSVESSEGALSQPVTGQPSIHFGQDMPIIDAQSRPDVPMVGMGDPANSFLIYKVLMAELGTAAPTLATKAHLATWNPISPTDRAILSGLIPGREMPFPATSFDTVNTGLSLDQLETLSLWISQGAPVFTCP
jgi:hypothetical protein